MGTDLVVADNIILLVKYNWWAVGYELSLLLIEMKAV